MLDELERLNPTDFGNRLELTSVGVGGHSFGGYTAFAVAGATLDFDFLAQECSQEFAFLNVSLLLQCQALNLPQQAYDFQDPRVGSIVVFNPVNSSIFGPTGLGRVEVPVAVIAGSLDPATPFVFEQFRSFPWLGSSQRSLALIEGQAHVDLSQADGGLQRLIKTMPELTLADPALVNKYVHAITTPFFLTTVARRVDFRLYLRSSYAQYLSQNQPFPLHVISYLPETSLEEPFQNHRLPLITPP